MTSRTVLGLSGSPTATSKTAQLVEWTLGQLACEGIEVLHIRARELDARALLAGDTGETSMARLLREMDRAQGLVIGTPIFKAAYTGLLKATLDLMPQFGLAGKVVLPLATGGSPAHVLALDYGLRPVLQSMGARHVVQSHFVAEPHMQADPFELADAAREPLLTAIEHFLHSLTDSAESRWLGHPKPPVTPPGGCVA